MTLTVGIVTLVGVFGLGLPLGAAVLLGDGSVVGESSRLVGAKDRGGTMRLEQRGKAEDLRRLRPPEIGAVMVRGRVGGTGAFWQAENASPSTRRVSRGSITPSSHRRAVE